MSDTTEQTTIELTAEDIAFCKAVIDDCYAEFAANPCERTRENIAICEYALFHAGELPYPGEPFADIDEQPATAEGGK